MSGQSGIYIDLTDESPPARAPPPRDHGSMTMPTDTHIRDWSSSSRVGSHPSHSFGRTTSASNSTRTPTHYSETIVVGSDDEDDDDASFTITGGSEPVRNSNPLQRSFSLNATGSSGRPSASNSASSLRFHDGIGRGPHGFGSRIPQSLGILSSSSPVRHPLLPQRRAAIPSTSTTTARRSGGNSSTDSSTSFLSRLGGNFAMGNFGFGTTYSMELIGSLIRGIHGNGGQGHTQLPNQQRKPPQNFEPEWTHPHEVQPGYTHSIIEPPVDLDTYFDDKAVVTGPLPDTTPICAGCRHALVTGATGDRRIWMLPCGHIIDGRCVDRLSGLTPTSKKAQGKAKAIEAIEETKARRTSTRSRVGAAPPPPLPSPKAPSPAKAKKPKRFECPVQGCGQKCSKESGGKLSAWEIFV